MINTTNINYKPCKKYIENNEEPVQDEKEKIYG